MRGEQSIECKDIVQDYVRLHRDRAARELAWYEQLGSDAEAIDQAAMAEAEEGKRHCHQRRIPRPVLEESRDALIKALPELKACDCFDDLLSTVETISGAIRGIGELTVYDTALRVGARFGKAPDRVYVHAGTREGAQALGFDGKQRTIEMTDLPTDFSALTAREAEDALCIYKSELQGEGRPSSGCGSDSRLKADCGKRYLD